MALALSLPHRHLSIHTSLSRFFFSEPPADRIPFSQYEHWVSHTFGPTKGLAVLSLIDSAVNNNK
jgi:hypothetical protein